MMDISVIHGFMAGLLVLAIVRILIVLRFPHKPVATPSRPVQDPPGIASTGVPQAMASTITRPNGSFH